MSRETKLRRRENRRGERVQNVRCLARLDGRGRARRHGRTRSANKRRGEGDRQGGVRIALRIGDVRIEAWRYACARAARCNACMTRRVAVLLTRHAERRRLTGHFLPGNSLRPVNRADNECKAIAIGRERQSRRHHLRKRKECKRKAPNAEKIFAEPVGQFDP